jgi:hypothetical protein
MSEPSSPVTPRPIIRTYLVGDLACPLCGAFAGTLESDRQPLPQTVQFTPAGTKAPMVVPDWKRLRCPRCGTGLLLEGLSTVKRRFEPAPVLAFAPVRRGRPPKQARQQPVEPHPDTA